MSSILYSKRTLLSLVVIVLGFNVGFYWIRAEIYRAGVSKPVRESERNEHSTPRSFILPATPAVAFEQEMRSGGSFLNFPSRHQIAMCAVRLMDLGYEVGDEAVAFNAKLSEAIFEYQRAHGLDKTGKLNYATIRSLSCELK